MTTDFHLQLFFFFLVIFGCAGSSKLSARGLFSNCRGWELLSSSHAWASHCGDFCCGAQAQGAQASVVAMQGLSSCGLQLLCSM